MGLVTKANTFSAGATIVASEHNSNFDTLYDVVNGNLDNNNIDAAAAIANTKLNLASIAQAITMTGNLTLQGAANDFSSATISDLGTVTTADINAGTIDNCVIGADTAVGATFSNLTATTANIDGGTLDGVQVGGTTATGELLINNATDDADGLGVQGTSGQVLTSAGAGANPTFETPDTIAYTTGFGSWAAAVQGSSTQATSDSIIVGYVVGDVGADDTFTIKTDSADPPTTIRVRIDGLTVPFSCPIKKNDYYLLTKGTDLTVAADILPIS